MAYSVRYGKVGFECDVCGVFVGDIRLLKSCYRCHKDICPLHARWTIKPASLRPQFRFSRLVDKFCYVCPECDEERQREEQEKEEEVRQRQEEIEEEEARKVIPRCQVCGAHEAHAEGKTFPSPPLSFTNCERCGKLICNFCATTPPDCHKNWFLICKECCNYFVEEDEREREEYWRKEEENKLEE